MPLEQTRNCSAGWMWSKEYLGLQIRKAHALRLINDACYGAWALRVAEIGRMLGAWIKQVDAGLAKVSSGRQARLL